MNPQIYRTIISEFDKIVDALDDRLANDNLHPDDVVDLKLRRETAVTAFEWAQKMLALHVDYVGIRQEDQRSARKYAHLLDYPIGNLVYSRIEGNELLMVFELLDSKGLDGIYTGGQTIADVFPSLSGVCADGRYVEV